MRAHDITGNQLNYMRMLQVVSKPELEPREIENAIKGEASLCYRLLRYMNSAVFGFSNEIHSVRHALSILGEREVRRWVRLVVTLSAGQNKIEPTGAFRAGPGALLRTALSQNSAWRV
jgi:c-di-GMP-related signal transduction protein